MSSEGWQQLIKGLFPENEGEEKGGCWRWNTYGDWISRLAKGCKIRSKSVDGKYRGIIERYTV